MATNRTAEDQLKPYNSCFSPDLEGRGTYSSAFKYSIFTVFPLRMGFVNHASGVRHRCGSHVQAVG